MPQEWKAKRYERPLWREADEKAQKKGKRHTVYSVNGDQYTGEWLDNLKSGNGTYTWKKTKAMYEGDWSLDKRNGYGTLSFLVNGAYKKQYTGGWKDDKRHGYGTHFYTDDEYYEGEWYADKRSGWGRMFYTDGSIYEGAWHDDKRNGDGLLRLANNNRYEGSWMDDKKNGSGRFFYLDTGQVLEGVWVNDGPKCGEMIDFGREEAGDGKTQYPIRSNELAEPQKVLKAAKDMFTQEIE